MYELPLFPLNTVLFPGAPLHLHIFEDRYKQMINMCVQDKKPFGVVLIRRGVEAQGPLAEPYSIGCTAEIIHVQRLNKGRMNIVAMGQERFRILSLKRDDLPYLVGNVEQYPLQEPSTQVLEQVGEPLRRQVERLITMLVEAGGAQFNLQNLPEDPVALAYMAAAILQNSPAEKQAMLSLERADDLLTRLKIEYRREVTLTQVMVSSNVREEKTVFSRN